MNKKYLAYLAVLFVLVLAGYFLYLKLRTQELSSEKAAKLEVATFSLEGEVASIDAESLVLRTGRVERTGEGNKVVEYEQRINFKDEVNFSTIFRADIPVKVLSRTALLSSLKVGDRAVFYGTGSENRVNGEMFVANRVELLRQAQ